MKATNTNVVAFGGRCSEANLPATMPGGAILVNVFNDDDCGRELVTMSR